MIKKRKFNWKIALPVCLALVLLFIFLIPQEINPPKKGFDSPSTNVPTVSPLLSDTAESPSTDMLPLALSALSSERMFTTLADLTSIRAHSGWRGSATTGEAQAISYLKSHLEQFIWLKSSGMTVERESFNVFTGTEDHTSSVFLTSKDQEFEVPADAVRGNRDDLSLTIRMDSDGRLNDLESNPVNIQGEVMLVADKNQLDSYQGSNQSGSVLIVNYSLVNTVNYQAQGNVSDLVALNPGAIILVSTFTNDPNAPPATTLGDGGGLFQKTEYGKNIPLLFIEIENLAPLGIYNWQDMNNLTAARVIWDTDVLNPAPSGNLVVHVPGKHTDKAMLISAHIDSANSPGGLDDGSGSAVLLEILSVLEEKHIKPDLDLYFAWFGSEELGAYGSTYFTTTHSELFNRLQADVQLDCMTRPLDGLPSELTMMVSHTPNNLYSDPLVKYLLGKGEELGIELTVTFDPFASDNGSFSAFNIPNLDLINESSQMNDHPGGVWAAGHLHDPYDTLERVKEMEVMYLHTARLVLAAALVPYQEANFVKQTSEKEVVFLANHTEAPQMTPSGFIAFSKELVNAGYHITIIPFGAALTRDSIADADLAVVLPVYDYPVEDNPVVGYDTRWTKEEAAIINDYVQSGGKLLVINSGARLKLFNRIMDPNEDWSDLNTLTDQWGAQFTRIGARSSNINTEDRGLLSGVSSLIVSPQTAVEFKITEGKVLAGVVGADYMALLSMGKGQVLILADMTVLGDTGDGALTPQLLQNIARWK